VFCETGKEDGLSEMGTSTKRVFLYVAYERVGEEEEVEAAALLEVDILMGDWMCMRCRLEEVAVSGGMCKEAGC